MTPNRLKAEIYLPSFFIYASFGTSHLCFFGYSRLGTPVGLSIGILSVTSFPGT